MHANLRTLVFVCIVVGLLLAGPHAALAQAPNPLSASVDRQQLTTDDYLTLTIVVTTQDQVIPQPELPPLDGFTVASVSSTSQISIFDGAIATSMVYTYRLQPTRTGELTINPITLQSGGAMYQTEPIRVEVTQGTGQPSAAPPDALSPLNLLPDLLTPGQPGDGDIFVTANVDMDEPYVGQQIAYTFSLYEASNPNDLSGFFRGRPDYRAPAFTGFWAEGDVEQNVSSATQNGRLYDVTELRTYLFPTTAGQAVIPPATLTIPGMSISGDLIERSNPVTVTVKPLPDGAPPGFAGAVGEYEIAAQADITDVRVDEPVTLRVTLTGRGNIGVAPDPTLPTLDGWRTFDDKSESSVKAELGKVVGQRIYTHLLIPTTPGVYALPAIDYPYFDPESGVYQVARTEPITVSVTANPDAVASGALPATAPAAAPVSLQVNADAPIVTDLLTATQTVALRPAPARLRQGDTSLIKQNWYWLLWAAPTLLLLAGATWQRRRDYRRSHADSRSSSAAGRDARAQIARLRKTNGSAEQKVAVALQVFDQYLAARLRRPIGGLTRTSMAAALAAHGVTTEAIAQVQLCLQAGELARYSPVAIDHHAADQLVQQVETTLSTLEAMWR